MSRPEPSSSRKPRASPPSNGSPSSLPRKSITTKSPCSAGPVDGLERGERLAQAVELGLRRPPRRPPARAGRPRRPCTRRAWPSAARRPRRRRRAARPCSGRSRQVDRRARRRWRCRRRCIACSYHSGSARRTASSSTASRPTCWSTTCGGHLALAEAGHLHVAARARRRRCRSSRSIARARPRPPRARASRRAPRWMW